MGAIMENQKFEISVNDLIKVFRDALISLIPFLEKVKIEWRQGQSYDDWDNISMTLYQNIVCSSLYGEVTNEYPINKYEFGYDDFSKRDYVLVICNEYSDKKLAFVSFQSVKTPLDYVKVAILDEADLKIGYLELKQENLNYSFNKINLGKRELKEKISVVV
jgi:hypothetical protein